LSNFARIEMKITLSILLIILCPLLIMAQANKTDAEPVTYEQLYDEPYTVNKLFIGFQPFYGELFATNVNAGFGVDAHYYHRQSVDFRAHFRKTYSSSFFDLSRENAAKNSSVDNKPESFDYFELGATWHVKDFDDQSKTKMVLYKSSFKGDTWAASVPTKAEIPCRVRKIYGARLGGIVWNSTLDVSRALQLDNKTNFDLGAGALADSLNLFSNIYSAGIYAGGSMSWIKNVAVSFDQFEGALDDSMITLFVDILYSPYLKVDNVEYEGNTYFTNVLKLKSFGFRAGIDGKFNRKLSWGYGGEFGYRPTVANMGFYAVIKIAIPLYGTNLEHKVQAVNKLGQ
jgi:hypothetical protein